MEEDGEGSTEFRFYADRAKTGRAGCKKCKQKIETGTLRMAKTGANPFGSGIMKMWHHLDCIFQVFAKQRASTVKIECVDDIGGWDALSKDDQEEILARLPESVRAAGRRTVTKAESDKGGANPTSSEKKPTKVHQDDTLKEYRRLLYNVAAVSAYLEKTAKIREFITVGSDGESYKGDLSILIRLLLPGVIKRVYNLQAKQIVKLFSRLFGTDQDEMLTSLEQGDVAETVREFFTRSNKLKPSPKSTLTLQVVDHFLEELAKLTREEEQVNHFMKIIPKCTSNDLKIIIRLIRHDLRINAGAKHILDAVHPDAYEAFQASRDINSILEKVGKTSKSDLNVGISLMVPVLPMLAMACKSIEEALKRCPNGMYSEVKYDGERVQVHKKGNQFKFYSRSLKPVLPHKVKTLEEFIPKAFPHGKDLILDSEILMIDNQTGNPLPFGTLGKHKKNEFKNANVCLFVFDCIYYNGESLLNKPLVERKNILNENMKEIQNRVVYSEMEEIHSAKHLEAMITKVFKLGLEGLVLKDLMSTYEPGKRHWLKVKKDYLFGGAMADSADLVVLGAWYGTGQKGGMMSVFLMGCYDEFRKVWCTVTKVHTGHDDATLDRLQEELVMEKISKDVTKVPKWLKCTKTMVPDFVAKDPKAQPVWEIAGAELTKNVVHTADGISVRFPRVTRIRDDKDWKTATNLSQLRDIYEKSKQTADFTLTGVSPTQSPASSPTKSPRKRPASAPSTPPVAAKKTKYIIKNPLPDVFVGVRLILPKDLPPIEKETIERYFIAYGGELLRDNEMDKVTHNIDKLGKGLDWIWDSIREQKLAA